MGASSSGRGEARIAIDASQLQGRSSSGIRRLVIEPAKAGFLFLYKIKPAFAGFFVSIKTSFFDEMKIKLKKLLHY